MGGAIINGHRSGTLTPQGAGKDANSAKHIALPMETSFYAELAAVLAPCGVFLFATFLHRVVNNFFTPLRWECFWCNFAPNKSLVGMVRTVFLLAFYLQGKNIILFSNPVYKFIRSSYYVTQR